MTSNEIKTEPCAPISFVKEIQMMMFGLGDSHTPLLSTAALIETVLLQQMVSLLEQADDVATSRESPVIEMQDVVFLLRKDKAKLKRLLQYIELKDSKQALTSTMMEFGDSETALLVGAVRPLNRKEECLKFLRLIGVTNVCDSSLQDQIKMERLIHADKVAQSLSEKLYQDFHKSRMCSFAGERFQNGKLFDWLRTAAEGPERKLKSNVKDFIVYLAKETIAQLVDLALLVRQDSSLLLGDPFSKTRTYFPCSPSDIFCPKQKQMEGMPPITPDEIREVIRRYWSPHLCPFGSLTRNTTDFLDRRLLVS